MYIDLLHVFLVFSDRHYSAPSSDCLVAMKGKRIWQLNLQQMSQILQPVFGSHLLQCNVLLSASVKGVSKVKLFSFPSMQKTRL